MSLEFTPEVLYSALKLARGKIGDSNRGISLIIKDESVPNNINFGIKTVEEFLQPFDELWKREAEMMTRPPARIDTGKFIEDLSKVTEKLKTQSGNVEQYR